MEMAMGYYKRQYITMRELIKLLMFVTLLSCNSQTKTNLQTVEQPIKTEKKMQTKNSITKKIDPTASFNIKEFKKNKGKYYDGDPYQSEVDYTYKLEDGTIVKQSFDDSGYMEIRNKDNYPLKEFLAYYHNGLIQVHGLSFNDCPIGITREYNKLGNLIKETDEREPYKGFIKPFKLSFDDIREIAFKTKGIDIYDTRQAMAFRHNGNIGTALPSPYYQIHVLKQYPNRDLEPNYSFLLDAETGEEFNPEKEARQKNLYKRYNGKDYTRKEWEAYMKTEEYKKNLEEYNKKGLWDKLFGN
jgi:hypothetical protein